MIVTAIYVCLLYDQNKLQQDPILKISPDEEIIEGEKPGIIDLTLYNTGVSDVGNILIFEDYFVPKEDNPLVLERVGIYITKEDQKIDYLKKGKSITFQIKFSHLFEVMKGLLKDKKGNHYRIVRIKIKFDREIDKKEFEMSQIYIILAGDKSIIPIVDERGLEFGRKGLGDEPFFPVEQIKRILGN